MLVLATELEDTASDVAELLVLSAAAELEDAALDALLVEAVLEPQPASIPAVIAAPTMTLTTCFLEKQCILILDGIVSTVLKNNWFKPFSVYPENPLFTWIGNVFYAHNVARSGNVFKRFRSNSGSSWNVYKFCVSFL